MNSSRNINASLFVTVLSACLGLLIVGVPVQAQLQSVSEDVGCSDKAPAEVESLLDHKAFIQPLTAFVADIAKLISIDKYDPKERVSIGIALANTYDGRAITQTSSSNDWLSIAVNNVLEQLTSDFGEAFYRYDNKLGQTAAHFDFNFLLENSSLTVKAKSEQSSPEQAQKFAVTYNSYFLLGACRERGEPDEVLYQNTKALADNNQVLIVTHLPRAALSELLAKKPVAD